MADSEATARATPSAADQDAAQKHARLAKKAGRFRILVIGKANAGKTTLLKKVCNTTEDPEIYDGKGKKIDTATVEPTIGRGIHDIENEMVFKSNPGFIFHDSRGFEAGGIEEVEKVMKFVAKRAKKPKLQDQIHVIWYCIPMNDSRPITNADNRFFSECGTGKVPVIVVFTKCDALQLKAFTILLGNKYSAEDARKQMMEYAEKNLKNLHVELEGRKYPPKGHVYLEAMDKQETTCQELIQCTAGTLKGNVLQKILVSTQQVSLELCMRHAINALLIETNVRQKGWDWGGVWWTIRGWFPYGMVM